VHGVELWVTDGTGIGTYLVKDIVTGTPFTGANYSSSPRNFTLLGNGKALFSVDDVNYNRVVWVSDGTAEGTKPFFTNYIDLSNDVYNPSVAMLITNLVLNGTAGNDILKGEVGNDRINGLAGADTMKGGFGNDIYFVNNTGDVVIETSFLNTEIDKVYSSVSFTLKANVENLTLTRTVLINGTGNNIANTLTGNSAVNVLTGYAGSDILNGGAANDILIGGVGKDTLTGGLGADKFKFNAVTETGITATTRDTINDFHHAQTDKIDLSAIDAKTGLAGNQAFSFIGNAAFSAAGQLRFDATTHIVYGSNDADIAPEFSILLTGVTSLTATDFVL
jgi:ELWxxDGT repeat protein